MTRDLQAGIEAILKAAPVVPVMVIERVADAVPLARALVKGGLPVLEITLRTGFLHAGQCVSGLAESGRRKVNLPPHTAQSPSHNSYS